MAAHHKIEVICLSSDEIAHSSPPHSSHAEAETRIILRQNERRSSYEYEEGREVWRNRLLRSVSREGDVFQDIDPGPTRNAAEVPLSFSREELLDPVRLGDEDPISSWGGHSPNATSMTSPKTIRRRIGESQDVIVIEDTPAKPPGHVVRPPVRPFISQNGGFSTSTASILADILGSKKDSDDELDKIDRVLGHAGCRESLLAPKSRFTKLPSQKRRSSEEEDDLAGTLKIKRKRTSTDDAQVDGPPGLAVKKKGAKLTEEERKERAEEKARKASRKEVEKEVKRLEKEAKALEKQKELELDIVNKLKTSKKDSVKEIIVDISTSFAQSPPGQQLLRVLETQECESTIDWNPPIANVIKWRRKVVAEWNGDLGYFIPIPQQIREEKHILVVVNGDDFVDMAIGEVDLHDHVTKLKMLLGQNGIKPIYLIEGLTALLRKSRNAKNRTFQGAVRQAIGASTEQGSIGSSRSTGSQSRKGARVIDEDVVEDALLSLQITHGCLIHHTVSIQETSEWISVFTGDISSIPYKSSQMNHDTSFCADVGQVRTGNDAEDTYFKMLQEITRVTAGVANGIMGEYKTVRELMNACRDEGEVVIADLEMMASRTGISSGRKIGQATSKRICRFFTGQDPELADM